MPIKEEPVGTGTGDAGDDHIFGKQCQKVIIKSI